jgi:hypothetical protein
MEEKKIIENIKILVEEMENENEIKNFINGYLNCLIDLNLINYLDYRHIYYKVKNNRIEA